MKKIFLISILFLPTLYTFSQDYFPLVDTVKLWSNLWFTAPGGPPPHEFKTNYIKFSGDTIIDSNHYKEVLISWDSLHINWEPIGFIREDSTKQVYYRNIDNSLEGILYDFNAEIDDTIRLSYFENGSDLIVQYIDSIFIDGKFRKRLLFAEEEWIEGIGSLCGILNSGTGTISGGVFRLLCFYMSDILIYSNPDYQECYLNYVGISNPLERKVNIRIYPIPTDAYIRIDFQKELFQDISIQLTNSFGSRLYKKNFRSPKEIEINMKSFPSGIYFISIFIDEEHISSMKIIKR